MIACGIVCSAERVKHLDFSVPIVESSYGALIPFPSMTVNGNAIAQPFKLEVVSFIIAIFIYCINIVMQFFRDLGLGSPARQSCCCRRHLGDEQFPLEYYAE